MISEINSFHIHISRFMLQNSMFLYIYDQQKHIHLLPSTLTFRTASEFSIILTTDAGSGTARMTIRANLLGVFISTDSDSFCSFLSFSSFFSTNSMTSSGIFRTNTREKKNEKSSILCFCQLPTFGTNALSDKPRIKSAGTPLQARRLRGGNGGIDQARCD